MMKFFFYLLFFLNIFFYLSCRHQSETRKTASTEEPYLYIVFDLDWTLISQIKSVEGIPENKIVHFKNEFYRVHDGAEELITLLSQYKRVKINFFSGGNQERNLSVLSQMRLTDGSGRSFLDIANKTLHRSDLTEKTTSSIRFSEKFKKDLFKIHSNIDQIIMVDDDHLFAIDMVQKSRYLWLGPTFKHFESWSQRLLLDGKTSAYIPKSFSDFIYQRNRLAIVAEVLLGSLDSEQDDIFLLVRKTWNSLRTETGKINFKARELMSKGVRRLGRKHFPLEQEKICSQLILPLLSI